MEHILTNLWRHYHAKVGDILCICNNFGVLYPVKGGKFLFLFRNFEGVRLLAQNNEFGKFASVRSSILICSTVAITLLLLLWGTIIWQGNYMVDG